MEHNYFKKYLEIAPVTLALVRAIECRLMSELDFPKPILDIGCGDGVFATQFFEFQLDEGMDLEQEQVERAKKTGKYKNLRAANAQELPYPDNTFNTVFSNCVFEHIPSIGKVLKEVWRVLRPGGKLIITVPSDRYGDNLLFTSMFRSLGMKGAGQWYANKINSMSVHINLFNQDTWKEKMEKAGLSIEYIKWYLSPKSTKLHDLMMLPGFFALVNRKLGQKMIIFRGLRKKLFVPILHSAFRSFYEGDSQEGSSLIIVAGKA